MRTDDYLADYARLGLQPGCSLETLERTWRLAVRDLHPDRAVEGLDAQLRSRRLHEVTSAYRRLRGFEREHGRLPGGAPLRVAGSEGPDAAQAMDPERAVDAGTPASAAGRSPVGLSALAVLVFAGLLGWSAWWSQKSSEGAVDPGMTATTVNASDQLSPAVAVEVQPRPRIRIGSTEAQVERLMGQPLVSEPDLWEYGPSHVRFVRGRVVGWYSSPLKPLPVDIESR